ncbi:MAG: conjugal transfer protein TraC [Eggerthella sp.]|mgnify:CR=1 FL=1|uniref:VirB4-like conjugal transfer ATPase, CD1110 family n=1 Tax=Eggerthella TaxID=84111 RepID=UPI001E63AD17|nr:MULTISPECIES: conjugal transfer protein TraC [Eggerthella]MDU1907407.1 conjugal transfer protein TraC [Eggerthella sp.]MDU5257300.1 conjugal transfer protein TraC [Eggerthella sp.]HJH74555.1 conjugal transfer protein TraC [Eggerthellaceae bacterium]
MSLLKKKRAASDPLQPAEADAANKTADAAPEQPKRPKKTLSLAKRRKSAEKSAAATARRQSRRRSGARDVYNAIGYDALYKDGICMVEPGLYSQTIRFTDISYQSASDDAQRGVCLQMRQLVNGLAPDATMQLTVVNRRLHESEIGNRTFFEVRDDATGPYAAEYNRILNDKMLEGVSNISRSRYLTFGVGAPSAEAAVQKLARLRSSAATSLASVRSHAEAVDGTERLQLLHALLRPGRPIPDIDWRLFGPATGLTTKDLVCPASMDFKPEGSDQAFTADGTWCQVLAFRTFESNLSDRCLADVIDLPIPLAVSTHVQPIEQNRALRFVKQRLNWIDKEVVDDQMAAVKKGYDYTLIPPELRYTREEAQDLYDRLKDDSQRLFRYTGLLMTYAPTRAELDEQVMSLVATCQANGIELAPLDYRQREGLNSVLPLGRNHVDVTRFMLTDEIAIQSPFATLELSEEGGGYYGQNRHSLNLVLLNRKKLDSPMGIDCGKPGSGKSFGTKREIGNTRLAYPDDEVIIADPANEYGNVAVEFGGTCTVLSPDASAFLNPLELSHGSSQSQTMQVATKIETLTALISASMVEGGENINDEARSIIARCMNRAAADCLERDREPLLGDFYDEVLKQPEPEAKLIALRLERFVHGPLSIFSHPSNVDFGKKLTCFSFRDLPDSMRAFGIIAVLEAARNRMYANFERGVTTWLYIDEVQSLFSHPATIEYISRLWAEGRKFGMVCTGITQNVTYLLDHPQGRNLILNSDYLMLHKQSYSDRDKFKELLGLSDQEVGYIDDSIKAGEGLLIAGGARVPIVDDFPRGMLYDLFNTKPDEVAELRKRGRHARG